MTSSQPNGQRDFENRASKKNTEVREAIAQARTTELEMYNQQLRDRDRLLHCVNLATQRLVAVEDLATALPDVLNILGEGTQQSRSYILKNVWNEETQQKDFHLLLEWDAPGIPTKKAAGGQFPVAIETFPDHLTAPLKAGDATQFLARELDGIGIRDRIDGQALSLMGVPITIDGEWWGLLGLDDCVHERVWSDAESAVLKTAATAIGSAIERTQVRAARADAEEALRNAEKAVLEERERAARDRATELARINEAISQTLTALAANPKTDAFLGLLMQELARQTGACKTHLYLYDAATSTLRQHCAVQDGQLYVGIAPSDPDIFAHPIPTSMMPAWEAIMDSPIPLTFSNLSELAEDGQEERISQFWWPETLPWHLREGHCAVACSRMRVGDIPVGYICFAFIDSADLSPAQLEFIQALTNQATLSVHLTYLAGQSQSAALSEERNRLAREIHDTLAQAFTGISLQLEAARGMLLNANQNATSIETALFRARDLARKGLSEARRSVRALRSEALESDTLVGALRKMLSQTARDTGLSTQFHLQGVSVLIPDDIQLNLLRIAQEATTNVLRHAQATQLDITLRFVADRILSDHPHNIQLVIADDGVGFDPAALVDSDGFGIIGIRERATRLRGEIELQSKPGDGTMLIVTVPLM